MRKNGTFTTHLRYFNVYADTRPTFEQAVLYRQIVNYVVIGELLGLT